ncbi:DUF2628 domain-containing protein [Roseococcus sp. SYP-B2431]|uniref:DUF2628 domain-containing protein n=1 Tax=Roseococcus sp. SYP-B2431 TaxID=2496640 RepID=UPI001039F1E0|nr:DUF2628 domain-containing protein [Roseococcus sp. SYP-B2431]TCH99026.1 DUF2628 domain-containing protein [Roseococcus sp. SYP-B2431]
MRSWTIHLPPPGIQRRPAALIPEGFSLWAFLFGPFWLLRHRCWIAGGIALVAFALASLAPAPFDTALPLGLALLLGFHGQDLRRWTLERRGMPASHVVLGRDEDAALLRATSLDPALLGIFAARVSGR